MEDLDILRQNVEDLVCDPPVRGTMEYAQMVLINALEAGLTKTRKALAVALDIKTGTPVPVHAPIEAAPDRKLSALDKLSKINMHRNERIAELEAEVAELNAELKDCKEACGIAIRLSASS